MLFVQRVQIAVLPVLYQRCKTLKPNKQNILEAASGLFLEGGTKALSVRAIAKSAGVSTIGIYSHFEGKQGVLDALYIEGFEKVSAALEAPEAGGDPDQILMQAARKYLDLADQYRAHYRLIFGESEAGYQPSSEAKRFGAEAFEKLTRTVAAALPSKQSRQAQREAALQIWSLLHGSVSLRYNNVSQLVDMKNFNARVLEALAILIKGLAS